MNVEHVITGLVTFLKARAATLSDPIVVIGLGDPIPNEGVRMQIEKTELDIVAGGLCYFDVDLLVIGPAKQPDPATAATAFTTACGFLNRALPARDATQRDALRAAILAATSNLVTLHFHHHGEPGGPPPQDPHRHQRMQRLRLGISE